MLNSPYDLGQNLNRFRPIGAPPGLFVIPEWVTADEEQDIVDFLSRGKWSNQISKNRPTQHFGKRYNTLSGFTDDGESDWGVLRQYADRVQTQFPGTRITQCLVNAYFKQSAIGAHRDRETPLVFGLSLVNDINMIWTSMEVNAAEGNALKYEALIPRRSLYIMSGEAALGWTHEIPSRKTVKYPAPGNMNGNINDGPVVTVKKPDDYMRVSVTWRHFSGELFVAPNLRAPADLDSAPQVQPLQACHLKGVIPRHQEMEPVLFREHEWRQMQSRFGKPMSRLVCAMSDKISRASGVYASWIELFCERVIGIQVTVNAAFANLYPDGNSSLPAHRDEYTESNGRPLWVFGLSFGETRTFSFIPNGDKSKAKSNPNLTNVEMASGDILLFAPVVNKTHKHQILAEPKRTGRRINITYFIDILPGQDERKMLNPPEIQASMIPTFEEAEAKFRTRKSAVNNTKDDGSGREIPLMMNEQGAVSALIDGVLIPFSSVEEAISVIQQATNTHATH